jgi:hypothetical protein
MDQALIRRNDVTDDYLHSRANAMQVNVYKRHFKHLILKQVQRHSHIQFSASFQQHENRKLVT